MKVVIEISERDWDEIQELTEDEKDFHQRVISEGTPLPEGHGDLKDVSKIHLYKFVNCKNYLLHPLHSEDFKRGYNSAIDDVWNVLREAQTIIEADKEAKDDNERRSTENP